jgi:AraC-like DNA-binding protein
MATKETKAKGELSVFTEVIWRHDDLANNLVLVPDGTFNILVANHPWHVGDKFRPAGIYFIPVLDRSMVVRSGFPLYGLRLKIFSLHNLIQCNAIPVKQTKEIFRLELPTALEEQVFRETNEAQSLDECLFTLENLNYELIYKNYKVNALMRDRVNYILDRKGDVQIKEMCAHFGVSRQALHKSFKQALGISPKDLSSIWRLNHFIWKLRYEANLTACAYDVGYYDQAHSIKEFQSKYALSPTAFLKEKLTTFAYVNDTIERRFTNFYDPEL